MSAVKNENETQFFYDSYYKQWAVLVALATNPALTRRMCMFFTCCKIMPIHPHWHLRSALILVRCNTLSAKIAE